MALAVNSLRSGSLGQGWGSLEPASLLSSTIPSGGPTGREAAAQNHASRGSYPLAPAPAAAAIETPGVHTGLKLNTHPGLGPEPASACCRGRHGNMPRAGQRAESSARGYSLHRGALGGPAARCCGAHRRCSPLLEPGALAAPRARWSRKLRELLPSPPAPPPPLEG